MLAKLEKFKAGLSAKANESANATEEEELSDWAAVTLKFTPEPGKVFEVYILFLVRVTWS